MSPADVRQAMAGARRFLARAQEALDAATDCGPDDPLWSIPKESGALRRASLDLTRPLAAMRNRWRNR